MAATAGNAATIAGNHFLAVVPVGSSIQIGGLHHQRVAFVVTHGITGPARGCAVRAPIDGNDAEIMQQLRRYGHLIRRLHDVIGIVVSVGYERRASVLSVATRSGRVPFAVD